MFKRKNDAAPAASHSVNDAVQQARTRARQRLIGAAVLLVIGIIGFPIVFESQPRPIPVDIAIDIPHKDNATPLVMPAERTGPPASVVDVSPPVREATKDRIEGLAPTRDTAAKPARPEEEVITETRADAGRDMAAAPLKAAPPLAVNAATPVARPASPAAVAVAEAKRKGDAPPPAADKAAGAEGVRARALLEGKPVAAAEAPRFVVQVGAFAEADAAREVRLKVEKLGMKTYTQIAQTPSGNRIRVRVGPFTTREEADRALAKARAAGITANVLTL